MTLRDEFYDGRCGTAIHPWEFPDCPRCETNVYADLDHQFDLDSYHCYKCGERFRPPDYKIRERVSTAKERQARSGRQ